MAHFKGNSFVVLISLALLYVDLNWHAAIASEINTPAGHLKPFGGHRDPETVDEVKEFPTAEHFMENYVRHSKPLVFRGAAKQFPAFSKWTEEFMKENYGDLEVRLEAKKEKQGFVPVGAAGVGRDTISNFIDKYHETNRYIVSELPTPMWKDVSALPSMSCGPFIENFVEIDIWMSGGDTSSLIHKDAYNTINCVVNGTKEWKLIEFKHQDKIYQFKEEIEGVGGFSRINASSVDLFKYPLVRDAPWKYTVINKGDCLYLPGSMWHQVQSHGTMNVAVAFLFSRFEDKSEKYDYSSCVAGSDEKYKPLDQIDVDWQYPGYGEMSMGVFDFKSGLESLQGFFSHNGKFSLKRSMREFKESWQGGTKSQLKEKALGLRKLLRKWTEQVNVTWDDVSNMTRSGLREVLFYIHPAMPENTMEYEYHYVREEEIYLIIKNLLRERMVLNVDEFVDRYITRCGGTKKFALGIWARLCSDKNKEKRDLTEAEVKSRLRYASYKYKEGSATESGFVFAGNEETFADDEAYAVDKETWDRVDKFASRDSGDNDSDAYEGKILDDEITMSGGAEYIQTQDSRTEL